MKVIWGTGKAQGFCLVKWVAAVEAGRKGAPRGRVAEGWKNVWLVAAGRGVMAVVVVVAALVTVALVVGGCGLGGRPGGSGREAQGARVAARRSEALVTPAEGMNSANEVVRLDGSKVGAAELDATVLRLMQEAKVTGVGLAVLSGGSTIYLKGYGAREVGAGEPLTPDTIMSAASLSKPTFGYLVMQLVQEGVLDLDKPIQGYLPKPLPEYGDYKDLRGDERYKKITARMLLDHTSGFPNWRFFMDDKKLSINFEPGSRFAYSGEGIALLQLVVEKVTNRGLEELMQEKVFGPLGMTRTSMTWHLNYEGNHAEGFDENGKSLGPQRRMRADAAGSMKTTPRDFAMFLQAVADGKGLKPEIFAEMLKPQIAITSKHEFPTLSTETTEENRAMGLSYGLGWGLFSTARGKAFFKEGHDDGWRNYAVYFSDARYGIVIMTNSSNGESVYKGVLEKLGDVYTPWEWEQFTDQVE